VVIMLALLVVLGRRQRHGLGAGWPVLLALLAAVLAFGAVGLPGMVREGPARAIRGPPQRSRSARRRWPRRAPGQAGVRLYDRRLVPDLQGQRALAIEREETRAAFEKAGVIGCAATGPGAIQRSPVTSPRRARAGVPLYLWYPAGAARRGNCRRC
jgi:hypothetical protein